MDDPDDVQGMTDLHEDEIIISDVLKEIETCSNLCDHLDRELDSLNSKLESIIGSSPAGQNGTK